MKSMYPHVMTVSVDSFEFQPVSPLSAVSSVDSFPAPSLACDVATQKYHKKFT